MVACLREFQQDCYLDELDLLLRYFRLQSLFRNRLQQLYDVPPWQTQIVHGRPGQEEELRKAVSSTNNVSVFQSIKCLLIYRIVLSYGSNVYTTNNVSVFQLIEYLLTCIYRINITYGSIVYTTNTVKNFRAIYSMFS